MNKVGRDAASQRIKRKIGIGAGRREEKEEEENAAAGTLIPPARCRLLRKVRPFAALTGINEGDAYMRRQKHTAVSSFQILDFW